MTELQITRLCAEAMGLTITWNSYMEFFQTDSGTLNARHYNPLHDDAQAMALVKKFGAIIESDGYPPQTWNVGFWNTKDICWDHSEDASLNRAICECVAKMQAAKGAR